MAREFEYTDQDTGVVYPKAVGVPCHFMINHHERTGQITFYIYGSIAAADARKRWVAVDTVNVTPENYVRVVGPYIAQAAASAYAEYDAKAPDVPDGFEADGKTPKYKKKISNWTEVPYAG